MNLKANIIANYASQFYITGVGILMLPIYIRYMGAEAYGLVGFFSMMQVWFSMLDMGISPTVTRETARFNGGASDAVQYRQFLKTLEGIFAAIAIIGGLGLYAVAGVISQNWLKTDQLSTSDIEKSLQLMSITIALRWMCGLYRATIIGSERLVWISSFNSFVATLRFVLVVPVFVFVSVKPTAFFAYQLGISIIEFLGLVAYSYRLRPSLPTTYRLGWQWAPLRPVLRFSMTVAFTSSIWILITQTDKLILSKLLPLAEYGYFTLAVLMASSIMIISGPISGAILPRMTRLEAEGKHDALIELYRNSTQLVVVSAGAVSITLGCFSRPLLYTWTGNVSLAETTAPILSLYAFGNGILAAAAFPYYLQYAKGNLRLHLIGNLIFVVLLIPGIVYATMSFGAIGAGYAWLLINILSFFAWIPLVHHKFSPGLNRVWYINDVLSIAMPMSLFGYLLQKIPAPDGGRIQSFALLVLSGIVILAVGLVASSFSRERIRNFVTARTWRRYLP